MKVLGGGVVSYQRGTSVNPVAGLMAPGEFSLMKHTITPTLACGRLSQRYPDSHRYPDAYRYPDVYRYLDTNRYPDVHRYPDAPDILMHTDRRRPNHSPTHGTGSFSLDTLYILPAPSHGIRGLRSDVFVG